MRAAFDGPFSGGGDKILIVDKKINSTRITCFVFCATCIGSGPYLHKLVYLCVYLMGFGEFFVNTILVKGTGIGV